jgi:hypothetical protein
MHRNFRPLVAAGCLAVLLGIVYLNSLHRIAHRQTDHQSKTYGQYTSDQILARTVVLLNRLGFLDRGMRLSPSPKFGRSPRGEVVKMWDVVCTDGTGRDVTFFTWNAVTGNLLCYSDLHLSKAVHAGIRIGASEAVSAAQGWLVQVDPIRHGKDWRPIGHPTIKRDTWVVHYTTTAGGAMLEIDARSGQPIFYRARFA